MIEPGRPQQATADDGVPAGADPDDPRADLRWRSIPALVTDVAARRPGAEAVADGVSRLTVGQLAEAATDMTKALMASGVAKGDRVALWAPNCAQWIVAALGVLGAGGVLVPLNTRFKGAEASFIVRTARARLLFTVEGFLGVDYPRLLVAQDCGPLEEIVVLAHRHGNGGAEGSEEASGGGATFVELAGEASGGTRRVPVLSQARFLLRASEVQTADAVARAASVSPEDPSDLIFTSGTTGRPKGALASHSATLRTYGSWGGIAGLAEGDRYLLVNPLFHTFGYKAGMVASLMFGATIFPEAVFDVDRVLRRIEEERITALPGPPTLFQSILAHPGRASHDLSSLRVATTGAAIVPVELVVAMREELGFETVLTAYGLTESCGTATMCRRTDPPEIVADTSGRAIPGLEVRIVGTDGAELERGAAGEIVVRGYNVMLGYFEDPEATAEAIDGGGWLHTGDVGTMDEAGNVTITDRLKDMFVVGGFNAYPAEIEALLRGCPGVGPLAVVGVPDERLGEVGAVYLARRPPGTPGAEQEDDVSYARRVLRWSRDAMANYKAPRYAVVLDALPLNATGKVVKSELRQRFADRDPNGAGDIVVVAAEH